jgi:hypothetical protein
MLGLEVFASVLREPVSVRRNSGVDVALATFLVAAQTGGEGARARICQESTINYHFCIVNHDMKPQRWPCRCPQQAVLTAAVLRKEVIDRKLGSAGMSLSTPEIGRLSAPPP